MTLRERISTILEIQQGTPSTAAGPVVLISQRGEDVALDIQRWETEMQAPDLLRSAGTIDPVVIQAITRTYDPEDPTLWIPLDQRSVPQDDSPEEIQYDMCQR